MTECDGYLDLMIMVSNAKIASLSSLIEKMGFETFRFTLSSDKLVWCCLDLLRLKTGGANVAKAWICGRWKVEESEIWKGHKQVATRSA